MYQLSHFSKKLDLGMALFMASPYLASYGNSQVTFRLRNRHRNAPLARERSVAGSIANTQISSN